MLSHSFMELMGPFFGYEISIGVDTKWWHAGQACIPASLWSDEAGAF